MIAQKVHRPHLQNKEEFPTHHNLEGKTENYFSALKSFIETNKLARSKMNLERWETINDLSNLEINTLTVDDINRTDACGL